VKKPAFPVAVILQRKPTQSRWVDCVWEPLGVLQGYAAKEEPRLLRDAQGMQQWLHTGFTLTLHRDEAEGYYMNVSSGSPRVFVLWRLDEAERGLPLQVTASYDEGGRWLDGGHSVDGVAMPDAIFAWVGDYVEKNYRPEPKKRIKPRSFVHPKDRAGR